MRHKTLWTFCTICLLHKIFQLFMSKSLCDEEYNLLLLTGLKIIFLIVTSHTNWPKKFQLGQVSF